MKKLLVTALATPFLNGKIDRNSYAKLVKTQIPYADALTVASTTGESSLLSESEKRELFMLTRALTKDMPLIVNIDKNATAQCVKSALYAAKLGADALLVSPPSFCKCTMQGYLRHIAAIKSVSNIPIILYNVPSRCGYEIDTDTVLQLRKTGVRTVKDAGSDLRYTEKIAHDVSVLCGNDELLPNALQKGAIGAVSVVSNLAPSLTRDILQNEADADAVSLFVQTAKLTMTQINPIAVKYMLCCAGIFASCEMRLPLTPADGETRKKIDLWLEQNRSRLGLEEE